MRIASKVALVTGASSGIGQALSEELARCGARLALTSRTPLPDSPHLHVPGDLTDPAFRRRLLTTVLDHHGRVDILVHAAGIGLYSPPGQPVASSLFESMFALNFFAAVDLAQNLAPGMRQRGEGLIVGISSLAGRVVLPWFPLYSASKFALGAYLDGLRMEYAGTGVSTLTVCPGYVSTRFADSLLGGPAPGTLAGGGRLSATPAAVASATCQAIEAGRRAVIVPSLSGRLFIAFSRLLPGVVESLLIRQMRGSR